MIQPDLLSNYILKLNNMWVIRRKISLINLTSLKIILKHGFTLKMREKIYISCFLQPWFTTLSHVIRLQNY